MTKRSNDNPPDLAQMSLGGIVTSLATVRAAKKANTLSRVHRRLIDPIETDQDNGARLSFQHTVFCQTALPYRNLGDDVRTWKRTNGTIALQVEAGNAWNRTLADLGPSDDLFKTAR